MRNLFIILLVFLCEELLVAQDVHWSQINENSMYQNPANTGQFNGDFRTSLSTKDQWRNVTKPYQTQAFTFDIINKYNSRLGYGGTFVHDVTGDGVFRTIELKIIPAYTLFQNESNNSKLRVGLDLSFKYNQLNFSNFMFDNQFDGFMYFNSLPTNEKYSTQQKLSIAFGVGLIYSRQIKENISINTGISLFNINQPNQGFYGANNPRDKRLHYFLQTILKLNSKTQLIPSLNFQQQGEYTELIAGVKCEFYSSIISSKHQLISGLYVRNKDGIYTQFGIKLNKVITSVSYDINISKLAKASNGRGGIEINVQYVWLRKQDKNIMHKKCLDYL